MSRQYGFYFNADRCVMCHACEVACKATRGVELGVSWRKVVEVWQGDFPSVTRAFLSLSCFHCANPACQQACPIGAISKRAEDGIVVVDKDGCTGCRDCLAACPYAVPQFGEDGVMQKCDLCVGSGTEPACVAACPANALSCGAMEDLASMVADRGGQRLSGPESPSLFISYGRGSHILVGRVAVTRLRQISDVHPDFKVAGGGATKEGPESKSGLC